MQIEIALGDKPITSGNALKSQTNYARWCYCNYKANDDKSNIYSFPY